MPHLPKGYLMPVLSSVTREKPTGRYRVRHQMFTRAPILQIQIAVQQRPGAAPVMLDPRWPYEKKMDYYTARNQEIEDSFVTKHLYFRDMRDGDLLPEQCVHAPQTWETLP